MAYSVDLREKAVLMIEKREKIKVEIAELMEIDSVPLVKKESCW